MSDAPSDPAPTPVESAAEPKESVGSILRKLGPTGPLAVAALALPPLSGIALFAYMASVSEWLKSHQGAGLAIYAGAFALLAGLAVLPTYAQAALGGYAFGVLLGFPAALVGFAGGATIGYAVARLAAKDRVAALIREHPKWQAVRDALLAEDRRKSFWKTTGMVALLRMPPNSPFALTNLVMASVKVPWASFITGTVLGMAPRTLAAVFVGSTIQQMTDDAVSTPRWLKITGIVASVIVLLIVMRLADRAIKRAAGKTPSPDARG
jgi:uncharacterized membrane protein YdjX (TVP38/TMEM64 family)